MDWSKRPPKIDSQLPGRDGNSWASFYFDNFFSAFSEQELAGLLNDELAPEFGEGCQLSSRPRLLGTSCSGEMLQRLLYTDIKTYLVELLMKQDNMSMAASIESRVPFLDHKLVEFAARIPRRVQIAGLTGKKILKTAMRDLLPHSIVYRQKLGFPTPWSGWLRGPQLETIRDLLLEPRSLERELFKPESLERLFREHRARVSRPWRSHLAVVESGAVAARLPGRRLSRGRVARTGRSRVSFDLMMDTAIPQAF